MRQIRPDLWETRADAPSPGLTTHAYLWTPPGGGNVLFYNTAGDDDLEQMARLGGVAHQYLSHRDEVAPMLATWPASTCSPASNRISWPRAPRRRRRGPPPR